MKEILHFAKNFFNGLNNNRKGHSLKKWLTIGAFWLMFLIILMYTNSNNLFEISSMLSALIITLMGINVADKKLNGRPEDKDTNNPVI